MLFKCFRYPLFRNSVIAVLFRSQICIFYLNLRPTKFEAQIFTYVLKLNMLKYHLYSSCIPSTSAPPPPPQIASLPDFFSSAVNDSIVLILTGHFLLFLCFLNRVSHYITLFLTLKYLFVSFCPFHYYYIHHLVKTC